MPTPSPVVLWALEADLDNDGIFETDWTPYLKSVDYGLGREDALSAFGTRSLRAVLGNPDSRFSPKNLSGPYGANLKRGRLVRLLASMATLFGLVINKVQNPSLETNITGHNATGGATVVRTTTEGVWGRSAAKVTTANLSSSGSLIKNADASHIIVTASGPNTFVVWVNAPAGKQMRLRVDFFNATPTFLSSSTFDFDGVGAWQKLKLTATSPGTAVLADLLIITRAVQGVFDFHYDGVMFTGTSDQRPYVDGDQANCTWDGTAHASISRRAAADEEDIVQGIFRIREFRLSRDLSGDPTSLMELEATTDYDNYSKKVISYGAFTRKKANLLANRVVDLLEEGEIILDGAHRTTPTNGVTGLTTKTPDGETYVGIGPPNIGPTHGAAGKTDPADYASLEGDNAMTITWFGDAAGEGWKINVTARTVNDLSYTVACFFATQVFNAGKRIQLQMVDDTFTVHSTTVTLVTNQYVYAEVSGAFGAGSTVREVQVIALDTPVNETNGLIWDCLHMVPTANRIARSVSGLDYDIEYMSQIQQSGSAMLMEFARSACAWVYEDVSGGLVFEQASTSRSNTATPKTRLSDGLDGLSFGVGRYNEGVNNIYKKVRVGTYGDISHIEGKRRLWNMEPPDQVLGANQTRIFYVTYASEEGGTVIGRLCDARAVLSAGALVATYPWLQGFGEGATVIVKATAAGATIKELYVEGRIQNRNTSEHTFQEYSPSGSPLPYDAVLELEAPGQGTNKAEPFTMMVWAGDKYVDRPARFETEITGGPVGTDDGGIRGWEHTMEIIGRDIGLPVWLRHKNGPGAYFADELYYVEGRRVSARVGEPPRVTWSLEEA